VCPLRILGCDVPVSVLSSAMRVVPDDACLLLADITIMARPPILAGGPLTCTDSVGVAGFEPTTSSSGKMYLTLVHACVAWLKPASTLLDAEPV
jgi:hypothetical protein